jgi:hypothetical protein
MPRGPIKNLPEVKAFAEYFLRKAKKDLKLKRAGYHSASVEYTTRGKVYVWFFTHDGGATHIIYNADGTRDE